MPSRLIYFFLFISLPFFSAAQKDPVQFDHIFGSKTLVPVDSILSSGWSKKLPGYWKFKKLICVGKDGKRSKAEVRDTSIHLIAFFPDHTALFNTKDKIFWKLSPGRDTIVLYQRYNEKFVEHYYSLELSALKRRKLVFLLPTSRFKDAKGNTCDCERSIVVLRKTKKIRAMF